MPHTIFREGTIMRKSIKRVCLFVSVFVLATVIPAATAFAGTPKPKRWG